MKNYDFEEKNRWRRMIWQRVIARLRRWSISPDTAIALYLPGPDDLDRSIAIKKGFRWNNLIAVDRDAGIVAKLRTEGKLALCGDMINVLRGWKYKTRPQVICADFCSNLNDPLARDLREIFFRGDEKPFLASNAVMVVNFQRGRERVNHAKGFFESDPKFAAQFGRDFGVDTKHRGLQFLAHLVAYICWMIEAHGVDVVRGIGGDNETDIAVAIVKSFSPELFTYKGIGGLRMDSVILTRTLDNENAECISHDGPGLSKSELVMRRRVAACMALRTTRMANL